MDPSQLQVLVQRSTLLSADERAYWLQTLPTMTAEQQGKLEAILSEAEKISLTDAVHTYFNTLKQTPAVTPSIAA